MAEELSNDNLIAIQNELQEAMKNNSANGQTVIPTELLERVLKLPPLIDDMIQFIAEKLNMPETKQAVAERIAKDVPVQ